jgi:hypothetical protein
VLFFSATCSGRYNKFPSSEDTVLMMLDTGRTTRGKTSRTESQQQVFLQLTTSKKRSRGKNVTSDKSSAATSEPRPKLARTDSLLSLASNISCDLQHLSSTSDDESKFFSLHLLKSTYDAFLRQC